MPQMYVKYNGDVLIGYAYGDEWVSQALFMDDWCYKTEEEAIQAWKRFEEKERKNERIY